MALQIGTITAAIANLSVTGLTVVDSNKIPLKTIGKPMLFPEPLGFVSDFSVERQSQQLSSGYAQWDVHYTLNYTFWYCPIGSGGALESYQPMVTMYFKIIDAILAKGTFSEGKDVDMMPQSVAEFGPVQDPSGNVGLGCKLAINILEYV